MIINKVLDFGPVKGIRVAYSPIGTPLMSVICYTLDNILIDTGPSNARRQVLEAVNSASLQDIYLTHYHEDHAGNAAYLNNHHQIPVHGHPLTVKALSQKVALKPYERFMWGKLEQVNVSPLTEHFESENYSFQVIHTPGHCQDHVVFFEPNQGWLFSGDMYLGSHIKYFRFDENIYQTIQSLKTMAALNIGTLFCGHNPQSKHPQRAIKKKIDYLENICGNVQHLRAQGCSNKEILRKTLKGKEAWVAKLITLGDVSYRNLIQSALNSPMT